ncbi:MAG: filamentous hemagglutinin N-terminal domain-containing protein, partial [Burkholderiaceae bacterium]
MNRSFRLVWSSVRSAWLVAPESAKSSGGPSRGKTALKGIAAALVSTLCYSISVSPASAQAPAGLVDPVLRAGSATIDLTNAQRAVVQQSSQKAVIDWRQFNVAKDSSIQFVQPNASAIALNRVTGAQASRIDGSILANGQVWLINPNGVLIGKSGRINTHGFLASTLGLSTDNFMQGNYSFQADSAGFGSVVNEGQIISAQAGYAVLAGRQVKNDGLIQAQMGQVVLASGKAATLDLVGDGLLRFAVTAPVDGMPAGDESLIENTGRL